MPAPTEPSVRQPDQRELRAWADFDQLTRPRPEERAVIGSALLLTILLHGALFFWVIPWLGNAVRVSPLSAVPTTPARPPVEYVLTPLTAEDKQAIRYLETNPAAPDSKPVATNNISNRDQHAAQPVPDPNGHSDLPATNGQTANSSKIVAGDTPKPQPPAPPPTPAPTPEPTKSSTASAQPTAPPPPQIAMNIPSLPGNVATSDGFGVHISDQPRDTSPSQPAHKIPPNLAPAPEDYKLPPGPLTPEAVAASAAAATPLERPTLMVQTHDGPILKNTKGTHDQALNPAVDAKWTPFGAYLQMMFEAIGSEWDIECDRYNFSVQDSGAAVVTTFVINRQGEIESVNVESSSATRGATLLCLNAIKHPAPFGVWTEEMAALLGERQTIQVTFYYQ
jgi:hypothetical protein